MVITCGDGIWRTSAVTYMVFVRSLTSALGVINIWLPSTLYYRFFHKTLKYKMIAPWNYIPPRTARRSSSAVTAVNNSTAKVAVNVIPSSWTQQDKLVAIAEAKDRYEHPLSKNVTVKRLQMNKNGTLLITLSGPVRYPTYLKEAVAKKRKGRRLHEHGGEAEAPADDGGG